MVLISASPVRAQNVLWVSPNGNDANVCSQTAPCLTFQGAINKGNVAEINCLAAGSYGVISIASTITIDCGSGNVGNLVSSSSAITINAASAVTVVLRHLSFNGLDTAANGVITQGSFSGSLTIEDCTFQRYAGAAIGFLPSSGRGLLQVSDTEVINNGVGITVEPSNNQIASMILNRVVVSGSGSNGIALESGGVIAGTIRDSVVASSTADGIFAGAPQTFVTIESSSIIANLANGIHANSVGANLSVTGSTISGNGTGINVTRGFTVSLGNNTLNGNAVDGAFSSTIALK
jgi:hypothetical protein